MLQRTGIVAFAFGKPETILSNRIIGRIATQEARQRKTMVFTQSDVIVDADIIVEYAEQQAGLPPSTLQMARNAIAWAKKYEFTRLCVVAATPHLKRCIRDLKKSARENNYSIMVFSSDKMAGYIDDLWYCPNSAQKRTQSSITWVLREKLIFALPFWLYKKITA